MIISLGYRIKSSIATQFRRWVTERLRKELLDRIRDIKLYYAAHGHTTAEVIYERANAEKPFMGLTSFKGDTGT